MTLHRLVEPVLLQSVDPLPSQPTEVVLHKPVEPVQLQPVGPVPPQSVELVQPPQPLRPLLPQSGHCMYIASYILMLPLCVCVFMEVLLI